MLRLSASAAGDLGVRVDDCLSQFEIKRRDLPLMEAIYTGALGFVVTDRSANGGMGFLSAAPGEHHRIVLAGAAEGQFASGSLDHLAFRPADLSALRRYYEALERRLGGTDPKL